MKAELVYNTKEEPRILLTFESAEERMLMSHEPNLSLVMIEDAINAMTKMSYAIVPSHAREKHAAGEIQPLSTAERKNWAYAMGPGKSEADYQRFIERYEATVEEGLDECIKARYQEKLWRQSTAEQAAMAVEAHKNLDLAIERIEELDRSVTEMENMGTVKNVRRDEATHRAYRDETQSLLGELATIFGPFKPKKGMNRNASILAQIGEHLTKSDDRIEELEGNIKHLHGEYGKLKLEMLADGVEAAGIMLEATESELLSKIGACKDCGAVDGQLCNPGCTQESYQ